MDQELNTIVKYNQTSCYYCNEWFNNGDFEVDEIILLNKKNYLDSVIHLFTPLSIIRAVIHKEFIIIEILGSCVDL